jgi:hypothetical protein
MCVDDGEALFLGHHIASTFKLFVQTKRLGGKHWISGQHFPLSFGALKFTQ